MTTAALQPSEVTHNPLDTIEEIAIASEWAHERSSEDELMVQTAGRWCDYRMIFVWNSEWSAMQFGCQFDARIPNGRRDSVDRLLSRINERLWIGHFDLCPDQHIPIFRQTMLFRGIPSVSFEVIEDLVEIAISECDRFYPAFQFVLWGGGEADEAFNAAILDTVGEA